MSSPRRPLLVLGLLLAGSLPLLAARLPGDDPPAAAAAEAGLTERIVAGGADDFMEVRHVVLRGTQREIGRLLAEIARERHGVSAPRTTSPEVARVQRVYMERNFPLHLERMRGAAEAFGVPLEDDGYDFSGLSYDLAPPGCTVVFYPPQLTASGTGILSRNYDFSTGTLWGTVPPPGQPAATSHPYLIELHPDRGYASISLCAYDLLGGVIDGINSEGLCVALLADDELMSRYEMEGTRGPAVGLGVLQAPRLLLDTCATVGEAREALRLNKHVYSVIPCHYIVADRFGDSFVFEYSQARNKQHFVEGGDEPLITTNFMLHKHPDPDALPQEAHPGGSFNRYCRVREAIQAEEGGIDLEFVERASRGVAARWDPPADSGRASARTLWHSIYVPEERRLLVDFYLGEAADGSGDRRSGYVELRLER